MPNAAAGFPSAEPFGPVDEAARWPEAGSFVWLEKKHIAALGLKAFVAADSVESKVSPEVAQLLTRLGREFLERHPNFGSLGNASSEAATAMAAPSIPPGASTSPPTRACR